MMSDELYLFEIEEQCRYAIKAWKDVQSEDTDIQWYSIQAFLTAVANISKFFWPSKGANRRAKDRADRLRKLFSLDENSPLKSRDMRDSFEHSDERLDEWLASSPKGTHLGRITIRGGQAGLQGLADGHGHYARYFERDTGVLSFYGERYDLNQIISEVETLYGTSRNLSLFPFESHPSEVNTEKPEEA